MKKVLFMFAVLGLVSCGTTETTEETTEVTPTEETTACPADCSKECCSAEGGVTGVTGTTGAVEASSLQDVMPTGDVTVTEVEVTE